MHFNNPTVVKTTGNQRAAHSYYPYGLTWSNIDSGELHNKAFQGKDFQQNEWGEHGIEVYDFHARMYDPVLGRWSVVDPLAHLQVDKSPYHFVSNNPISRVDPTGKSDDWVEDSQGNITWKDDVTSSNDQDLKEGETYRGKEYRRFENIHDKTYNDVQYKSDKTVTSTAKLRPDIDGVVTQDESIDWYHFGGGVPLMIDIRKFNFKTSKLSVEDFKTIAQSVDFFNGWSNHPFSSSIIYRPALDETLSDVYGTIRLAIVNSKTGEVRVVTRDDGSFDTFDYSALGSIIGNSLRSNGNPTPFLFFGYGTGFINLNSPDIKLDNPWTPKY
jgi:RHS repeat-associated protein